MSRADDAKPEDMVRRLVEGLDSASPGEIHAAIGALGDIITDFAQTASKRKIAGYLRTALRHIKL